MTDNLTVSRGVFLGSSGDDAAVGVAVNSDHIIIAAGNVNGSGTLYRLSPQTGSSLLSETDLGGTVSDLALVQGTTVGQQDRIVVVGNFGLKVYDPTGATVIWEQAGNFQQVAVTTNGTVITLAADKTLSLWSNTGSLLDSSNAISDFPGDIAISQDGTQVYVTGYNQPTAILQVPFIRAFNIVNNQISDTEAWDSWDFSSSAVEGQSLGADSSGRQITIGEDGNLYFLGRTDGGNNVFQRDPNAIATVEAGIVNIDTYTNFSNTGSGSFTFYAQIDPSNGDVIKGQYLLTRLSAGGGNSYSPGAITVDGEGNVYVGGTAAASLPDRANQQINGNPVAGYSGGDVALFSTSIDLGTRNFWTPFTTNSGTSGSNGSVVGVATGEGFQVLLATAEQPGELFAENGATPLGGNDIYLAVVDITPPSVVQLTPADNLTDVPLASDLQIQFTEGVQLGTGSVTIHRASDNSIVETIAMTSGQVNVSNDTLTINPTNDLAASTDYYVQIAAGAIEDLAGNDFAGIADTSTWNFTTTQGDPIVSKIILNEFYRAGNLEVTDEWIEVLLTEDLTAAELNNFFIGDSTSSTAAKFSGYQFTNMSTIATTFEAGTLIVIGGDTALTQDTSYNPSNNDWNILLRTSGGFLTSNVSAGDLAGTDVVYVDTNGTNGNATISADGFAVNYDSTPGIFGANANVTISAPSNNSGVVFTSNLAGATTPSNWSTSQPLANLTLGSPNGGDNTTYIDGLRTGGTPTSLDLSTYVRIGRYNLPEPTRTSAPSGSELALEVSAITYNPTTDTLFVLGDEGTSIVQVNKQGQLIDSMTLTSGDFADPEGLTYVGSGNQFVLVEERLRQASLFTYTANTTLSRAGVQTVDLGTNVGNIGLEGVSYDPQTSGYIFVKEVDPQGIFQTTIDFGAGTASNGSPTTENSTNLFDPALLGLTDIADVFALANSTFVSGDVANNLFILSQEDGKVVEVDRTGTILSTLTITADPGNPLSVTNHGFEGVTLDSDGLLYLTSESGGGDGDHPQVWVYAPADYVFTNAAPVAVSVANPITTLLENADTTSAIKLGNIIISDDSLGTNTLSVSGTDAAVFEIVGTELFLKADTVLDFDTQSSYEVTIAVDDASLGDTPDATTTFTLNLQDTAGTSDLIISEVAPWSSGNSSLGADWFEVTNTGANAIDITGWVIDDDSANFGSGSALSGVTSIAPGQSVVFVDGDAATITAFIDLWFGGTAPTGFTIGTYDGPGLGTGGDAVNLFNAAGSIVTGSSFGASPGTSPFATFDNAAGAPSVSNLSVAGTNGAFSVIDAGEGVILTGSPGTIAGTPTATTTIGIVATGATASENGPTAGEFTILRTGDTTNALDVTYSILVDAGNGTDFAAINATTVTIPGGASQITIAITPIDDNEVEGNESVTITLVDTDDYNLQPGAESATVTIEDNDTVLTILSLQITEFMYSGGNGEFIEFTNNDTSPVDMTGWSFSDSARVAGSFDLSTFGTVQPGESVILTEADAEAFRTAWNLSANTKIIGGLSQNLGRNDEINLYDAANNLVDRLTYGDGNFPGTIRTQNVSGWVPVEQLVDQEIDTDWVLSSVDDAQNSYASTGGDIGNPGTYITGIVSGVVPPVVNNFDEANTVTGWQSISVDADTTNTFTVSTSFSNAEANGFGDTTPANDWLISPAVNLDTTEDEIVSFSTQTSFTDSGIAYPQLSFLYSTNYSGSGDPTQATWTPLSFTPSPENSGQFTDSGNIDISGISGTNVYFAFQYQSSGTGSGTAARWRVDSFNLRVDTPPPPPVTVKINEIQGSGDASPLVGQTVTIEAIVVGDFQTGDTDNQRNLNGFYVQEEDGDADGNALTSEGLFIFDGSSPSVAVNVGDKVQITGTISEFFGETQLTPTTITVISPGNPLPTAATITLPTTATTLSQDGDVQPDLEAFEGMLVNFTDTLTISEMLQLDRFNEIKLVQGDRPVQFTQNNDPSAAGLAAHLQEVGARTITYDDGLSDQNALIGNLDGFGPTFSTATDIRMGDTITGLSGVLSYQWAGNSASGATWRVRSTANGDNTFTKVNDRPATPEDVGGSLKVTGFNVLNYFTTIDLSGVNTAIGQDPRGADTADEFDRQTDKLVTALLAIDADVLGLVELENDFQPGSSGNAIEFLVNELNAIAGAGTYDWVDPGTQFVGTDAIAVGLIYKPGAVSLVGNAAILDTPAFVDPNNTGEDRNRPAVAQTFEELATGGTFTAVVNHLKSKGASGLTAGDANNPDSDQGDGQGFWNDTRAKSAQALVDWLATDPTGVNDSDYILLGDFNAYAQEDPVKVLEAAGYVNLADNFSGGTATSYVFDGQVGTLDYAFASASLFSQVTGATEWGINSDEADALDYNLDFGRDPAIADLTSPVRTSDHDPVIVGLTLVDEFDVTTPTDTDATANTIAENAANGSTVGITASATDGDGSNNTVTYSLTDNAGGRFTIDPSTGVVTVLDSTLLDFETAISHTITVQATSSDTSTATQTFTIAVSDVDEASNLQSFTPGDDIIRAGINGFSGVNSLVFSGAGNDEVDIPIGGANLGSNRIFTGSGSDTIFVADSDRAFGGSGDDEFDATEASGYRLSGGAGDDQFFLGVGGRALGGDGNDTFTVAEDGGNLLSGGAGSDLFNILTDNPALFTTPNTIVDFTVGTDTLGILNQGVNFGFNDLTLEGNEIKVGSNPIAIAILVGVQTTTLTANDFTFS